MQQERVSKLTTFSGSGVHRESLRSIAAFSGDDNNDVIMQPRVIAKSMGPNMRQAKGMRGHNRPQFDDVNKMTIVP